MTREDEIYIRGNFIPLAEACHQQGHSLQSVRDLMTSGHLPGPAYVMEDGSEMVAPDYFALLDAAGSVDALADHFAARYQEASKVEGVAPGAGEVHEAWQGYLTGEFAVCLFSATPEAIFKKRFLMTSLDRLLGSPMPQDPGWSQALKERVGALDTIERPFAPFDRVRWGPVSRDRYIRDVMARFPEIFRG